MKQIKVLMDALQQWNKRYRSFGDYSVTTLIDTPRVVHLKKRHAAEIIKTPEQMISAFVGSGVHSMFEESLRFHSVLDPKYDIERTVFDKIEDRLISGKFDILWDSKHIYDIKTCKTYKKIFDPDMVEWHKQQNIYALLLHNRGLDIRSINIIAVYLDWQKKKAAFDKDYPQEKVIEYELNLWDWDTTTAFLVDRIRLMKANEDVPDEHLPLCTDEDMWVRNKDTVYAVYAEPKATRALKLCASLQEARDYATTQPKKIIPGVSLVEVRKPARTRCEDWCEVQSFCTQWKEYEAKLQSGEKYERITL